MDHASQGTGVEQTTTPAHGAGAEQASTSAHSTSADPGAGGHSVGADAIEKIHQAEYSQEIVESLVAAEELEEAIQELDAVDSDTRLEPIDGTDE